MSPANDSERHPSDPTLAHAASLPYLTQHEQDGAWVIAAHGAFDASSSPSLAEALERAAEKYPRVVVDSAGVTFADSSILNVLLQFNMTKTELRVARPTHPLRRVLELTGADTVLVPQQATFAPSRRSPTALRASAVPPLAAPAGSPSAVHYEDFRLARREHTPDAAP
ncbi:STAS domain-containing protein [Streptomyces sp. NPDC056683]|uniref:STAS domain-containing protein n=1 Tax=Streptomyces sp. NPDC056683 TaxID=3345910 RepID=UPI0036821223